MSVIVALALAGWIIGRPKGTRHHRRAGWLYVLALTITAVSSFGIYEIRSGRPSVFHVVSIGIGATIAAGGDRVRPAMAGWSSRGEADHRPRRR